MIYGGKADAVRVSGRGATPSRLAITDAASTPTFLKQIMNCCNQDCQQGRTCPQYGVYSIVIRVLTALGMFAALMFAIGYAYASIPLVLSKTCTPSFIDRILK